MVFSSHIFLYYFLPVALLIYYGLYKAPQRVRNGALALMGYVFYGWATPEFVLLMLLTTVVDWLISMVIAHNSLSFWRKPVDAPLAPSTKAKRSRLQKAAITASVISNLAMLGYFKYANLGVETINEVFGANVQWTRVLLPLGISFYTFQSLSYTIDVYRGDAKVMRSFVDFACFVSMFPHLVAGPILKFSFLADQIEYRTLTIDKFSRGAAFFMVGLAKKVLIANTCAEVADIAFNSGSRLPLDAWWGALAYTFQIYFDFSGYSDMAIGLGLMLGFIFARNFDHPYRSVSITDFWRRWHISLSTWLREYLYIPLGGNRNGETRTYMNLMLTMLLGGLWHGASWNFVVWGGIHGGALALERRFGKSGWYAKVPVPVKYVSTFLVVMLGWIFFRAASSRDAVRYIGDMFGLNRLQTGAPLVGATLFNPVVCLTVLLAAVLVWKSPDTWEFTQHFSLTKAVFCAALFLLSLVVLTTQSYNPFIYFKF